MVCTLSKHSGDQDARDERDIYQVWDTGDLQTGFGRET